MIRSLVTRSRFVGGSAILALLAAAAGSFGARQNGRAQPPAATTASAQSAPVAAGVLASGPAASTRAWRSYHFELEATTTLPQGSLHQHLTGQLDSSPAADESELWHIGSVQRLGDTDAAASAEAVSVYGLVTKNEAGVPERVAFATSEPAEHRKWLEALVALATLPRKLPAQGSLELEERDASGTFIARYTSVNPGLLQRRKLRYTGGSATEVGLHILEDSASLTLEQGRIKGVVANQRWHVTDERISVESHGSLELLLGSPAPADASEPRSFDASFRFGSASQESERERDDRLVQGLTSEAAFTALFSATGAAARGRASERLSALLRRDPALLPTLLTVLRAHAQDELAPLLVHALADSGTDSAIDALSALLADPAWSLPIRRNACSALGLGAPPASVLPTLTSIARSDAELAPSAWLALGSALARATEHDAAEEAASAYLEQEYRAASGARRSTLLHALGNAGSPALLEEIPRIGHAKAGDRAALVWALRRVPGASADHALAHALFDTAREVRKAALQACTSQRHARCRELLQVAERDPDAELRLVALRGAARAAHSPDERNALLTVARRVAARDPAIKNRDSAAQLLRSADGGADGVTSPDSTNREDEP